MAGKLQNVLSRVASAMAGRDQGTQDGELLAQFLADRNEAAFAALMERHGPMVLGVCRRVLRDAQDAEDACQAAFLVLARKAAAVRKQGSLASWLHGVAWRVARKLQAQLARRRNRDASKAATQPSICEPPDMSLREACRILDEELNRLPANYKAPLVLCHLEGRTQDEAARELGWTHGTLRGQLERARERLRVRLLRRGVTGAGILTATALGANFGSAAVPPALAVATVKVSLATAAGKSVAAVVPPQVATLTEQVLRGLVMAKLKLAATLGAGLAAAVLLAGLSIPFFYRDADVSTEVVTEKLEAWSGVRRLKASNEHVWCVAFSPDGKRIAAGSGGTLQAARAAQKGDVGKRIVWKPISGNLNVWDADSGKLVYSLKTFAAVRCVSFSPDSKILATAEHDGLARLRDAKTGKVLFALRGHTSNVDTVAFSSDGKSLATSSWDGTVKIWDTDSGKNLRTLAMHTRQLFTVALGSEGKLASAGVDGKIRIWEAGSGKPRRTLHEHTAPVHWLAFSPDGKLLASASWDKTVKLWDTSSWKSLATLHGHSDPVLAVAFSPDGKMLASCSGSWGTDKILHAGPGPGDVVLWDLTAQKARARMPHPDRILGVSFSPDSETVASAGWDGFVTLWQPEARTAATPKTTSEPIPGRQSLVENKGEFQFISAPKTSDTVPILKKTYAQEFKPSLGEKAEKLLPYGPDASGCVKSEPDGLHINLPAGYPRKRPGTGVVTDFGIGGDFEITVGFELKRSPQVIQGDAPTELRVVVVPNEPAEPEVWHKADQNRAGLAWQVAGAANPGQFVTCSTKWISASVKDKWGNEIFQGKDQLSVDEFPTEATSGRLRIVRGGSTLYFYAAEGKDEDFKFLHKAEFGTKALKNVRVLATTPGPWASFDIAITDLYIRADSLPPTASATAPQPADVPWLVILFASASTAVLLLGGWLYVRRNRRAIQGQAASPVRTATAFPCPTCGKRLKVRPELTGKRVKCPHCGKAVGVPEPRTSAT